MSSVLITMLLCAAVNAHASTLCGTVRDVSTQLPISRAAVFLFDDQVARADGIVVEDTATEVSIDARSGLGFARAMPNPASDRVSLRWRVPEGASFTLEVFDLRGRRVQRIALVS